MKNKLTPAQELVGSLSLLSVGLLYGLSAVIAKYLSRYLNAYQVTEFRFGVAFIAATIVLILSRKSLHNLKGLDKKTLAAFVVTFPASAILFTLSVFHGSVALAVFSFYAANLITQFILGYLFFEEGVNITKGLALMAATISLLAFTNPFSNFAVSLGLVFGLIAGVIQGIASGFQKLLSTTADKVNLLVVQTLTGAVMAAIIILLTGKSLTPSLNGFSWFVTTMFGLIMLAIMYLFLIGYRYTNLNMGSILVSSELFFGPVLAYLLLSERIAINIFIGGLFTAIATIFVSLSTGTNSTLAKKVA